MPSNKFITQVLLNCFWFITLVHLAIMFFDTEEYAWRMLFFEDMKQENHEMDSWKEMEN